MEDTADPSRAQDHATRLRDLVHRGRHTTNAQHGLTCWGREGHDRLWGLWRDAGDVKLIDWTDLGPHGIIWALWVNDHDPDDMVVALETRDDDARPPVAGVRLMRLPGHRMARQVCSADHELNVGDLRIGTSTPLLRWWPHGHEADPGVGFGLLDPDFRERMPPVIRWNEARPVARAVLPHLVRYPHVGAGEKGGWGVFDIEAGRDVIPPIHADLEWDRHSDRWVANREDGTAALLSVDGAVLHQHAHTLFLCTDGSLCAWKDGLWGWADRDGALVAAPRHESLDALVRRDEPVTLGPLRPPPPGDDCAMLPAHMLEWLQTDFARGGGCYPFEGLGSVSLDGHSDGEVDLDRVVMPGGRPALRLTLRYARARWLVLELDWEGRPAGSLMRLAPRSGRGKAVRACPPGGPDEAFITGVLARI